MLVERLREFKVFEPNFLTKFSAPNFFILPIFCFQLLKDSQQFVAVADVDVRYIL